MAKVKNRKDAAAAPSERMTATDTLNLNPAFISRVKKEEGAQKSAMASKLQEDMGRMKEDQIFPDMQFVCGGNSIPGHKVIIKSRLKNITDDSCWYDTSSGGLPSLPLCSAAVPDVKEFMKVLYTSDDVDAKFVVDAVKRQTAAVDTATEVKSISPSASLRPEQNFSDNATLSEPEQNFSDNATLSEPEQNFSDNATLSEPEQNFGDNATLSEPEQNFSDNATLSEPEQNFSDNATLSEPEQNFSDNATLSEPEQNFGDNATLSEPEQNFSENRTLSEPEQNFSDNATLSEPEQNFSDNATLSEPEQNFSDNATLSEPEQNFSDNATLSEPVKNFRDNATLAEPEQNFSDNASPSSQDDAAEGVDHLQPAESGFLIEGNKNNVNDSTEPEGNNRSEGVDGTISGHDTEHRFPDLADDSGREISSNHTAAPSDKAEAGAKAVSDSETLEEATASTGAIPDRQAVHTDRQAVHTDRQAVHAGDSKSERAQERHKESPGEPASKPELAEEQTSHSLVTETDSENLKTASSAASHGLPEESEDNIRDSQEETSASGNLAQSDPDSAERPRDAPNHGATSLFADESRKVGVGDSSPGEITFTPCSGLAAGLLQCYLQQDFADCCLSVEGGKFLAHRCILASRCQYFEAMFAGVWTESDEAEIELHGVGADGVRYLLLFVYGAMLEVPARHMTSLIQASDMFGVEGLKDWLGFLLARDFCHFFHKPCQDCIRMVADVLVLASQFNMTSLAERSKRWVATHFRRIWEMPHFGSLPSDLLDECTKAVIDQMSVQNITQMILDSHVLVRCLQQNHRTHPVQLAAVRVMDQALAFCASHFPQLVRSSGFLAWSKDGAWCMDVLVESYTMVVSLLQPEVACDVYCALTQLLANSERKDGEGQYTSEEVRSLLKRLVERCEWYLHRYIHRVVNCPQWSALPADLQQQLLQKCSFVPAHAASLTGAKSRVAQKSAKVLQDNIVHTVTMLCETDPDLFPSLAQTRKILSDSSKQPPPPPKQSRAPAKTSGNQRRVGAPPKQRALVKTSDNQLKAGARPKTMAPKLQQDTAVTARQSEASKSRTTAGFCIGHRSG
ncbi:hypothetical protein ACOMHN_001588 [Nucella lapillus]